MALPLIAAALPEILGATEVAGAAGAAAEGAGAAGAAEGAAGTAAAEGEGAGQTMQALNQLGQTDAFTPSGQTHGRNGQRLEPVQLAQNTAPHVYNPAKDNDGDNGHDESHTA
jgi:hypothetical protein